MIKVYDTPVSGNCHKARLMLSILGLDYELAPINLLNKEHKTPEYLGVHPLGKVPALEDDGFVVWDGQAIVVYLAKKYGSTDWYPDDAEGMSQVQSWLAFAANEMWAGPAIARAIMKFKRPADQETAIANTKAALQVLDDWLASREFLACGRPTVADIAVYPYAAMAWEGDVDMSGYSNLNAWIKRIEALSGYVGMENMPRPE
jgi:glutathione S-transferase